MQTQHKFLVILGALLFLGLSACSTAGPATTDPLEGTSWELLAYAGTPILEGTTITASFGKGEVNGSGGCNVFGGIYQVEGSKIEMDALTMTLTACIEPEGVMDQESAVLGFLQDADTFEVDAEGQLLIYRADGEALVFVPSK
jgi:heat shock protein HslJ